ncbi:MAG: hypothetical protein K2M31_01410 [Muribaculaceae bacterium]|nr:hypothetical protein [Muribaculaceae bacterium]
MKIDTSDYYPWSADRKRPADKVAAVEASGRIDGDAGPDTDIEIPEASISTDHTPLGLSDEEIPSDVTPKAPQGWLTIVSHILSWVLSPVLTPTYGILAVFELSMFSYAPTSTKLTIIALVFSLTCVIPCAAIWVLTKFGDVSDMALTRRRDRLIPYIITAGCLAACGYYLTRTGLPGWVGYFYIGAAAATLFNLLVNFKWKISAHGAGIGGLIAMLLVLNRYGLPAYNLWGWVLAAVIAAGLLGAARVWLWRHTPMQTICGEIVGFIGVLMTEGFMN